MSLIEKWNDGRTKRRSCRRDRPAMPFCKNFQRRTILLFALAIVIAPSHAKSDEIETHRIIIDPSVKFQRIEGFGTSGAWWGPRVGTWDRAQREHILKLLYDQENGAGLTIHRYHVGAGGGDELLEDWRRAPCLEVAPGVYDAKRDPAILIAREAVAAGARQVAAFACSPPGRLTVSGKVVADEGQKRCNLAPENYQAYSDYLCDIVALLRNEGLPIIKFSPVNEPQWAWDNRNGEGVHFKPDELVAFLNVFVETATLRMPDVPLEVFDSGAWGETAEYLGPILDDQILSRAIESYSVHSYWATDVDRHKFMRWVREHQFDEPLHMSEWCEMIWGRSPGMESACELAKTVISDLTICHVRSWCSWLGVSPFDFRDALITVDESGDTIETNKRLWALANFSRFIRPGWHRIEATTDTLSVVAAQDPNASTIVCVIVNPSKQEHVATFVNKDDTPFRVQQSWITSSEHDLQPLQAHRTSEIVRLPPESVVTFVLGESH